MHEPACLGTDLPFATTSGEQTGELRSRDACTCTCLWVTPRFPIHAESRESELAYSTTPTLSSRSASPDHSPPTPARVNILRGEGKTRRVPAPLVLAKEKEFYVEAALGSARSVTSVRSRELKPPQSPNYKLLRGMEVCAPAERGRGAMEVGEVRTPVGVAF